MTAFPLKIALFCPNKMQKVPTTCVLIHCATMVNGNGKKVTEKSAHKMIKYI